LKRSRIFQSCIDLVQIVPDSIHVSGWIFHPTIPIDRVSIEVGGRSVARDVRLFERPDVEAAFPESPHARHSGFDVKIDVSSSDSTGSALVSIRPESAGEPLRIVHAFGCDWARERMPGRLPPDSVMQRAGGATSYLEHGVSALGLVLTSLAIAKPPASFERILDWGCGAGRITRHLAKVVDASRVHGCDIDGEAIGWAQQNLLGPQFDRVDPYPPTRFEDGFFDGVYGISVMTHLDEAAQRLWLEELRRITRPGAALSLSVIGEKLRATNLPPELAGEFERTGFAVFVPGYSEWFQDFSHEGYYQEAFHTPEYVERVWGEYFDVLEYMETGHQDLVVLRRL
jgi:SAM-dependent methyltransferase